MDGENDAAQSGQPSAAEQAAATQADGNPAGASGGAEQAQEVSGAKEPAASSDNGAAAASQVAEADFAAQIAERDARITELKSQLETQKTDNELRLAGCRSTRAARALLGDYDGDVAALKAAEPWLFADGGAENGGHDEETAGTTGLKPAGSDGTAATVARWERLAGLSDNEDKE